MHAGAEATFTVEARDRHGNMRMSGGDEWVVRLYGEAEGSVELLDGSDGTYALSVRCSVAGMYKLQLALRLHQVSTRRNQKKPEEIRRNQTKSDGIRRNQTESGMSKSSIRDVT